jgi:hypothetical protein
MLSYLRITPEVRLHHPRLKHTKLSRLNVELELSLGGLYLVE